MTETETSSLSQNKLLGKTASPRHVVTVTEGRVKMTFRGQDPLNTSLKSPVQGP